MDNWPYPPSTNSPNPPGNVKENRTCWISCGCALLCSYHVPPPTLGYPCECICHKPTPTRINIVFSCIQYMQSGDCCVLAWKRQRGWVTGWPFRFYIYTLKCIRQRQHNKIQTPTCERSGKLHCHATPRTTWRIKIKCISTWRVSSQRLHHIECGWTRANQRETQHRWWHADSSSPLSPPGESGVVFFFVTAYSGCRSCFFTRQLFATDAARPLKLID